jgi:hypothetical protein
MITMIAVVLALLLYYAQFSGSLQWVLGLVFLAFLASFAFRQVFRGSVEPAPLVAPTSPEAHVSGEMESVAASVSRAAHGLRYSQVLVTSRARVAFLDHARLALGLSPEGMREIQQDPQALRRLFGDSALAEFLHIRVGDLEERYGWVLRARARGGFGREFREVLAQMEAWH